MCGIATAVILLIFGGGQDAKLPVPAEEAQAKAEKTIRDVFKDEYASKTPAAQQKLARKLIEQGQESKEDACLSYVLFREAGELAISSGDTDLLLRSLDELNTRYQMTVASKESFLIRVEPNTTRPGDFKRLTEAHFKLVSAAVELEQFDAAAQFAQASILTARKSKEIALAIRADGLLKSVMESKASYVKAKNAEQLLIAHPDDPAANTIWGEYLCLSQGRWEQGKSFLAKGSESPLKSLSKSELALSSKNAETVTVADGWWDLAEKEKNPLRKSRMLEHARILYGSALPDATGLLRAKLEMRLKDAEMPPDPGKRITFHSPEQLEMFVTSGGNWRIEADELIGNCPGDRQWATLKTAFSAITQVTLRARIIPPAQHNLRLWVGPIHIIFNWEHADRDIYRNEKEGTDSPSSAIKPGKEYEISLKQQGSKVVVLVDGVKQWETEATLSGTVSIQAAHDSTIGVRQLSVDGTADPTQTVTAENREIP